MKKSSTFATVESNPVPSAGAVLGASTDDPVTVSAAAAPDCCSPWPSQIDCPRNLASVPSPEVSQHKSTVNMMGMLTCDVVVIKMAPVVNPIIFAVGPTLISQVNVPGVVTMFDNPAEPRILIFLPG